MKYFLCLCVVSVERRVLAGYARFHLMLLCHDHRSAGHQATQPGHGGQCGQCGHRWTAQIITRILFSHTQTDHHQAHLHIYHRQQAGWWTTLYWDMLCGATGRLPPHNR